MSSEPKTRADYHAMRSHYAPIDPRLIVVAESPPLSGLYFYDPNGKPTEALFAALIKQAHLTASTKHEGLLGLQAKAWLLVDATYQPVNDPSLTSRARDAILLRDYPLLRDDLLKLSPNRLTPVILIKANVCKLLDQRLTADGFNVLNNGRPVSFPSHGQQGRFAVQFADILRSGIRA